MPFGEVPALPPGIYDLAKSAPAVIAPQRPKITVNDKDGKPAVTLEADKVTYDTDLQITRLNGNVVATYGQTRLTAQEADIDNNKKEARFRQGVKLIDELGTLAANEIYVDFSEKPKGYAKGIVLDAYEAHFEGEELTFGENTFRLHNAWFTTCMGGYRVLLSDVVIKPGRYISARKSTLEIGKGIRIPIPFFRVGLNPNETGIQAPVPSMDEGFKFGYRWENTLAFGSRTSLVYNQRGGQNRVPSINTTLSYNFLHRNDEGIVAPTSEGRERFSDGFLDNVNVKDGAEQADNIGEEKALVFLGHATNITTRARPGDPADLDRPIFVGVEYGNHFNWAQFRAQMRYGSVEERLTDEKVDRMETYSTFALRDIPVGGGLALMLRTDLGMFSGGEGYGWVRPMAGLSFKADDHITLSAGYFSATQWGTPRFDNDRLYSNHAAHFRADFDFPSTDLSLLLKYDFGRQKLYDIEVKLGQAMDCIRPFFSYRSFPGTITFGFTLRAEKLFEALRRREQTRENLPPP
ncbi:MAG TPA: LptA/OstA family protein [Fimbriimonadales bacterium]|jgi:hypothetical protein|nr:LptA/OstA family protein [Fimbriimonadales bacterium]